MTCRYCGATSGDPGARSAPPPAAAQAATAQWQARSLAMVAAFDAATRRGVAPLDALRQVAAQHLASYGDPEVVARVVVGLAADVQRATGLDAHQPMVLLRLTEGYLKAVEHIAAEGRFELHLPYLGANAQGPVHYGPRELTAVTIAGLAAGGQSPAEPAKPQKRGFWGRLFGG